MSISLIYIILIPGFWEEQGSQVLLVWGRIRFLRCGVFLRLK